MPDLNARRDAGAMDDKSRAGRNEGDVRGDIAHTPKFTASADHLADLAAAARDAARADTMIVGDLQTGEVYEEPLPPPVSPEEFIDGD